jgi:hypothetical protein
MPMVCFVSVYSVVSYSHYMLSDILNIHCTKNRTFRFNDIYIFLHALNFSIINHFEKTNNVWRMVRVTSD